MSKAPLVEPNEGAEPKEEMRQRTATIGRSVITSLGRPDDFFKIVVIRLWEDSYRVNVLTGQDPASVRIAHSFFVVADNRGNVVESTPAIAKQY
ncbi:MAG: hypothetical protein JWO38_8322 [Gemmataceae bacterium]|nr:hypothetical protein [Gemmataceae bacterium]